MSQFLLVIDDNYEQTSKLFNSVKELKWYLFDRLCDKVKEREEEDQSSMFRDIEETPKNIKLYTVQDLVSDLTGVTEDRYTIMQGNIIAE